MLKKTLYLIVFTFFFQVSYAQLNTYEFEQLDSLQLQEKRPVFVLVHTKWCKYCAAMLHHIYKDESVVNSLKLFDDRGIMSYPSTIILNPNLEVKYRFDGYLVPKKLKSLLNDFKGELAY
jgi:thiol-disulfide isomerase/thioredoxin